MTPLNTYCRDQRGSSAAEFALVVPLFLGLVLGVIHMSLAVYSAVQLHAATQWTARCLSVSANNPAGTTTTCPSSSAASVLAYGTGRYTGPNISPMNFEPDTDPTKKCINGTPVTGSGTYRMSLGLVTLSIPITAKSCFPR